MIGLSLFSAFIAGVLSLLPACGPALLPVFLAISLGRRSRLAKAALLFMWGFTLVFIPFGLGVSFLVDLLVLDRRVVFATAGGVLIIFGVSMLFGISPKLNFQWTSNKVFFLGLTMGLTVSSCTAPVFGAILTLAATGDSVLQTIMYLVVFELGLAVPLILLGLFLDKLRFGNIISISRSLNILGAVVMMILGIIFILGRGVPISGQSGLINWFVETNQKLLY